jgi:hypothetical protein
MTDLSASPNRKLNPITVAEQGSFAAGGAVLRRSGKYDPTRANPDGQTLHGDHAFVTYQVPLEARPLPLVFVHGNNQFSKTWQTTPDGREGFQNIFLRRRFSCYLVDHPRRGAAGRSTLPLTLTPTPEDQSWFDMFRIGIWPDYFPGVQFPRDEAALDQFFRQITPDTGPFDVEVAAQAVAAVFDRIGPAILVTHSKGGGIGWLTTLKSEKVRGIVAYEPGTNFPFPHGEVPPPMLCATGLFSATGVPLDDFKKLTRLPIVIYYGDFIPKESTAVRGQDAWRVRASMAERWVDAVNRHGGNATLVHLPDIGIHGNTHFPFSDLNNLEIADQMSQFLSANRLD